MYYISMFNGAVIAEGKTGKPSADRLMKRFHEAIHGVVKVADFVKVVTTGEIPEGKIDDASECDPDSNVEKSFEECRHASQKNESHLEQ